MSLSEQQFQRNVWDTGKAVPLPGTAKNPQGRLMRPEYTGNPDAMSPENWLNNDGNGAPKRHKVGTWSSKQAVPTAGKDILTWHSNHGDMHDYENEGRFEDRFEDISEDHAGRPYTEQMGYAFGTHAGTIKAGYDRQGPSTGGTIAHPLKIARDSVIGDENGPKLHTDHQANHSANLTDMVEKGATVAYTNDVEDPGSVSYRASRDNYRTWNDDMDTAMNKSSRFGIRGPRPQYVAAHLEGYAPAVETGKVVVDAYNKWDQQPTLPGMERFKDGWDRSNGDHAVFSGQQWGMRKRTGE